MTDQYAVLVGGGTAGACTAAKAGHRAALVAVDASSETGVSDADLWADTRRVMAPFGRRFAAVHRFTTWVGAHEIDGCVAASTAHPGRQLIDVLASSGTRTNEQAKALRDRSDAYPDAPDDFGTWQAERDATVNEVSAVSGALPKH